jgi:uncharacterized protein YukE
MANQIRADFGVLDQLTADQGNHAANIENYRQMLRQKVEQALSTLDGGIGSEEHEACMKKVDQLIDEHITATQQFKQSTSNVGDTFLQAGQTVRQILGSGG